MHGIHLPSDEGSFHWYSFFMSFLMFGKTMTLKLDTSPLWISTYSFSCLLDLQICPNRIIRLSIFCLFACISFWMPLFWVKNVWLVAPYFDRSPAEVKVKGLYKTLEEIWLTGSLLSPLPHFAVLILALTLKPALSKSCHRGDMANNLCWWQKCQKNLQHEQVNLMGRLPNFFSILSDKGC